MQLAPLHVLYEDNHLLAVVKPAGLPTMGVAADRPSLLSVAKDYIKRRYHKPGNVYLGAMSRLDAPVSGVVLFARTSKAASRLTEQFRARSVDKIYWAVVSGEPPAEEACVDWIVKDERRRRMHLAASGVAGAQEARLSYRRLKPLGRHWALEIALETGRKHQIRLQLAHRGCPILGDLKYGNRDEFASGIALHARRLSFAHPVQGAAVELTAPLPRAWRRFDFPCGGDP
ncbi:MAG TPA: RluA family pseudouridine synthase [Pirellulales bacterium]|nr:RluA family pseudouridine synthase [Pirellulales bacterium]